MKYGNLRQQMEKQYYNLYIISIHSLCSVDIKMIGHRTRIRSYSRIRIRNRSRSRDRSSIRSRIGDSSRTRSRTM